MFLCLAHPAIGTRGHFISFHDGKAEEAPAGGGCSIKVLSTCPCGRNTDGKMKDYAFRGAPYYI